MSGSKNPITKFGISFHDRDRVPLLSDAQAGDETQPPQPKRLYSFSQSTEGVPSDQIPSFMVSVESRDPLCEYESQSEEYTEDRGTAFIAGLTEGIYFASIFNPHLFVLGFTECLKVLNPREIAFQKRMSQLVLLGALSSDNHVDKFIQLIQPRLVDGKIDGYHEF